MLTTYVGSAVLDSAVEARVASTAMRGAPAAATTARQLVPYRRGEKTMRWLND